MFAHAGEFLNDMGETIIDEEEYQLISKLQDLKGTYRTDYEQWKNLKSEITYCQNLVTQCQNRLLQGKRVLRCGAAKRQLSLASQNSTFGTMTRN